MDLHEFLVFDEVGVVGVVAGHGLDGFCDFHAFGFFHFDALLFEDQIVVQGEIDLSLLGGLLVLLPDLFDSDQVGGFLFSDEKVFGLEIFEPSFEILYLFVEQGDPGFMYNFVFPHSIDHLFKTFGVHLFDELVRFHGIYILL